MMSLVMSPDLLSPAGSPRPFYRYVLLLWLLITAILIVNALPQLATESFGDVDNYMRLIQVRDWLGGQAWGDVTQYRMNPPHGGNLHWSRLVDMPIALTIMAFRPLLGQAAAEAVALLAIPALLYLALMLTIGALLRDIAGRGIALGLLALLHTCVLVSAQFVPMRIDHHGWQLLMASIALLAWTHRSLLSAVIAGAALAFWMHVSIEGLPYAMLFGGLYAFAFVRDGDRRIHAYFSALTVCSLFFLVGTRGPELLVTNYCDAVSAPYVAALILAALSFLLTDRLLHPARPATRLLPPIFSGLGAIAGIALIDPACLAGPFASLDPVAREYWYLNVREGLPFWQQSGPFAAMQVFAPLPGVLGAIVAARAARGTPQVTTMAGIALAAIFAWLLGMVVMRANGAAQLYALPGMAFLILILAASRDRFRPRFVWSLSMATAFLLATAIPAFVLGHLVRPGAANNDLSANVSAGRQLRQLCVSLLTRPSLRELGNELLFAPIDVGPLILYHTDLKIVAAGYHRNSAAMATVIRGFIAPPAQARGIIMGTSAESLLLCPNAPEVKNYIRRAPSGLAAALERGDVPDWLVPDARLQQPNARLYTINR